VTATPTGAAPSTNQGNPRHNDLILEMRGITKTFPGVKALSDVRLQVRRGEIHAICGENGAGKSTLMKVLSGVYPAGSYDGEIAYDGHPVKFNNIRDSEKVGIVIIHQELALSPYLSIAENIFLGNERRGFGGIDWFKTNSDAQDLLHRVGLSENPTTKIRDIGVGKQQLVEIAKALSKEVRLLILDEPTAALNDADSEHLLGLLKGLRQQGMTCIIISHKLNEIKAIADSVTIIRDGHSIETLDVDEITEDRIIKGMVGRELDSRYPEHTPNIGEELLRIENWTVHHPINTERVIVDNANLTVNAGEIVGLAGLMGAGRTELAMSVFGRAYGAKISGNLYLRGKPFRARTVPEAIEHGLAYATEDRKHYGLNLIDDIKRNVALAALHKHSPRGIINDGEEFEVANSYRASMNIKSPTVLAVTGKLSGGNQQKVVLGKWLYSDPVVLILDEPTRGIDVGAKYEIYVIINKLAEEGKGVLVISSELPELLGICDRIYTLSQGRITGVIPREDATQEVLMRYMTKDQAVLTEVAPEAVEVHLEAPTDQPNIADSSHSSTEDSRHV
jgi:putative multiple sugar transport system ATP-binding protein